MRRRRIEENANVVVKRGEIVQVDFVVPKIKKTTPAAKTVAKEQHINTAQLSKSKASDVEKDANVSPSITEVQDKGTGNQSQATL